MIYYLIILFSVIISIFSQPKDEIVECRNIDLTPYQLDRMNFNDQEYLVNNFSISFLSRTKKSFPEMLLLLMNIQFNRKVSIRT